MTFNFNTVKEFDNHINMSIPTYSNMLETIEGIFMEVMPSGGHAVDFGCSTGKLLQHLSSKVDGNYTGVDVSKIFEAQNVNFFNGSIKNFINDTDGLDLPDVVLSIFTLQFLSPKERLKAVQYMRDVVDNGGTVIIAEKVYMNSTKLDSIFRRVLQRKKRESFTDKEILDKDHQLLGTMFCVDETELQGEIDYIGSNWAIWQSLNFKAYAVNNKM